MPYRPGRARPTSSDGPAVPQTNGLTTVPDGTSTPPTGSSVIRSQRRVPSTAPRQPEHALRQPQFPLRAEELRHLVGLPVQLVAHDPLGAVLQCGGVGEGVPPDPLPVVLQPDLAEPLVEVAQQVVGQRDPGCVVAGEDVLDRPERAHEQVVDLVVVELAQVQRRRVLEVSRVEVGRDGPREVVVDVRVDAEQRVLHDRRPSGPARLVGGLPRPFDALVGFAPAGVEPLEVEGGELPRQRPHPLGVQEDLPAPVVAEAVDGGVDLQRHDVVEPQEDRPLVAGRVEPRERRPHAVERLVDVPGFLLRKLSIIEFRSFIRLPWTA